VKIKDLWDTICSVLRTLRDPSSDVRWALRRAKQFSQYARRRLLFFRTPDVRRPGRSFAIAFQAYLSLAFAPFALCAGLECLRFFLAVSLKTDWTPIARLGAPIAALALGLALGFNLRAYLRSTHAASRAWVRGSLSTRLMSIVWFSALAAGSTAPALLQRAW
jgi:hypothetical protein